MGIFIGEIEKLEKNGILNKKGLSILDIGSSNLYGAEPQQVKAFVARYNNDQLEDIESFSSRLAEGSAYSQETGGINGAFAGELFEKAGMEYVSFDIADGYKTELIDLNNAKLPARFRNHFDLVLNFGTTEHLLNQFNAFKLIHEATKPGGYIIHSLPAVGFVDHGYITYTGRFFFDLAGYNEYEVVDFRFQYSPVAGNIYQSLRNYKSYFPVLEETLARIENDEMYSSLNEFQIPDVAIYIVYRKVKDIPYRGTLESSTSVGKIGKHILSRYRDALISYPSASMVRAIKNKVLATVRQIKKSWTK